MYFRFRQTATLSDRSARRCFQRIQQHIHATFTTLVVGVDVDLVTGSRPLFFGLSKFAEFVGQSDAVVKCCDSALKQRASGKQTLTGSRQVASPHLIFGYTVQDEQIEYVLCMPCTNSTHYMHSTTLSKWTKYLLNKQKA